MANKREIERLILKWRERVNEGTIEHLCNVLLEAAKELK